MVVAGGWALWEYQIQRIGTWNLQITLNPRVAQTGAGPMLVTEVLLENVGKTVVRASPTKRCIVSYWKLDIPQQAWTPLVLPCAPNEPLATYDLLQPYFTYARDDDRNKDAKEKYELEPGVKYHEVAIATVEPGTNVVVQVEFFEQADPVPMTEYAFIQIPERREPTSKATRPGADAAD